MDSFNKTPYSIPGFSLTSFNINQVISAKKLEPIINVGWLREKDEKEISLTEFLLDNKIDMYIPNVNSTFWENIELKNSLKENNITLCAWGAKKLSDVNKMIISGAEAMTVDWPEEAAKIT